MADIKVCSRTVMSSQADPQIRFDDEGVCHYVDLYFEKQKRLISSGEAGIKKFESIVSDVKQRNHHLPYDCILGISGGVDSSYLAYLMKTYDLRVLLFHFDNSWNSEIAVDNVNKIVEKTGWDLFTTVVDWKEFRDIQRAFIKADVVDIEMVTDHAIKASLYSLASKIGVFDIISGFNLVSEGIMPRSWIWNKDDLLNIREIHRKYGGVKMNLYPQSSFLSKTYLQFRKGLNAIQPFRFLAYNDQEAKETIANYFGWRDYGGKHYESVFTRFYQGYILPEKFGIDKRRAHYSSLICSGQLSREDALKKLEFNPYEEDQLYFDLPFVLKKLRFSHDEFEQIMLKPRREHDEFRSYLKEHYRYHENFFKLIKPVTKLIKKLG